MLAIRETSPACSDSSVSGSTDPAPGCESGAHLWSTTPNAMPTTSTTTGPTMGRRKRRRLGASASMVVRESFDVFDDAQLCRSGSRSPQPIADSTNKTPLFVARTSSRSSCAASPRFAHSRRASASAAVVCRPQRRLVWILSSTPAVMVRPLKNGGRAALQYGYYSDSALSSGFGCRPEVTTSTHATSAPLRATCCLAWPRALQWPATASTSWIGHAHELGWSCTSLTELGRD